MTLTVDQRDDLLEKMLPAAVQVVGSVRTRDTAHFAALTEALDRTRLLALLVDVAAMVPDDASVADLVRWTHGPVVSAEQYADVVTHSLRTNMKFCNGCKEWWRLDEFAKYAKSKDGRRSRCRACVAEYHKARAEPDADTAEVAA
jgi:predicted LPLAT superfamily acyltransferase